jgi:hypothetical protein
MFQVAIFIAKPFLRDGQPVLIAHRRHQGEGVHSFMLTQEMQKGRRLSPATLLVF